MGNKRINRRLPSDFDEDFDVSDFAISERLKKYVERDREAEKIRQKVRIKRKNTGESWKRRKK